MVLKNMASLLGVKDLKAQFYNSWAINLVEDKPRGILMIEDLGFVVAFFSQGVGAVQFHPESVGTSCPKLVLDKVLDVLYNGHYDLENGRCIRSTHY
jgi:anthranilate/para-aminobenzoate synthase component II